MTFSGHDPGGGAGLQADIETLASQNCHATPVITALTVQDTTDVMAVTAISADHVVAQAQAILADMPVAAFKIGMLGSAANARAIHDILQDDPGFPWYWTRYWPRGTAPAWLTRNCWKRSPPCWSRAPPY